MGLWPRSAVQKTEAVQASLSAAQTPEAAVYELRTGRSLLGDYGGWLDSPQPVSRAQALSVPAVSRGIDLIATTVAGLPMVRYDATGTKTELGWMEQPEAGRPRFNTFVDTGRDLVLDGHAFWRIWDRGADGAPKLGGCEYLELTRVGEYTAPNGRPGVTVDGDPVPSRDLIGFHGWHSGIRNFGARTLRTALALESAARRMADTPMPMAALENTSTYELSDDEVKELLDGWQAARQQSSVAYLNAGVKLTTLGFDPAQLQLVEARQFVASQVANLVGVPAHFIAGANTGGSSLTYSSVSQENRAFVDYGISPMVKAIEARLSMTDVQGRAWDNQVTPRGTLVRFSLDALLRGNPIERAQLYSQLVPLGVLSVQEARQWEDLAPGAPENSQP